MQKNLQEMPLADSVDDIKMPGTMSYRNVPGICKIVRVFRYKEKFKKLEKRC